MTTKITLITSHGTVDHAFMHGSSDRQWVVSHGVMGTRRLDARQVTIIEGDQLVVPYDPLVAEQGLAIMRTGLASLREMHAAIAPILTPELTELYTEQAKLTEQIIERQAECLKLVRSGADHVTCTAALFTLAAEARPVQSRIVEIGAAISTGIDKLVADSTVLESDDSATPE